MRTKYVIIDTGVVEVPIIFGECQNHSDFKRMGNIVGAGFVMVGEDNKCTVYGESQTLKMGLRKKTSGISTVCSIVTIKIVRKLLSCDD